MADNKFRPYKEYREYSVKEMNRRAIEFFIEMKRRRSIRHFSNRLVSRQIIEHCICTASTAPSGANLQPWHFVVVSDPVVKQHIQRYAEIAERKFYKNKSTREWVKDLEPLGTDAHKPFLLTAPYLIVIFAQRYRLTASGDQKKHYYVSESVGIATGLLITAIHHAGLASLTYTPPKMGFLNKILARPVNEKPYMILVVGYPAEKTLVPELNKKTLEEVATFM